MASNTNARIGRKILYALVIAVCGLILLLSLSGIVGTWAIKDVVSDAAVALFSVVEQTARTVRGGIDRIDDRLTRLEAKTGEISDATDQISQNLEDKGLVLVLLPEEKETELLETAGSLRDTFDGIRDSLARGVEIYRAIDRLPFISLPAPSEARRDKIEDAVTQTRESVDALRSEVADFRSGVSTRVDRVTAAVDRVTGRIQDGRSELEKLDAKMAALQAFSAQMQETIPTALTVIALVFSLLVAFVIYTQVEVIRLYLRRWRGPGKATQPAMAPTQATAEQEAGSDSQ
jgi:methyl-accepting chemotaxis protein